MTNITISPTNNTIVLSKKFAASAAFSEKMLKPGDVSDPVVGSYGIHILYYLRDIPGGYVELDEKIESYLVSEKTNAAISEAMAAWKADASIVYHQENIDAVLGAASSPEAETAE